ncbi:MAG: ABC transporter permease, partial [Actinomycetota bacterium]|nr:ABC transporter permease [Actinomycetota bacterium]
KVALAGIAAIVLAGVFAPLIVSLTGAPGPGEIDSSSLSSAFGTPTGPSAAHWFGVDQLGRDVFSRTLYGTRVSVGVAVSAAALSLLVGVTFGMIAGFRGGLVDSVISRLIETFLVVPYLLLAAGIAASCSGEDGCFGGSLRPGIPLVVLVISMTSWPGVARLTRNQTIAIRESEYIASARVSGLGTTRILVSEILPNLSGSILVFVTVLIPQAILAEAALSFLGVGVPASTPSWGQLIVSAVPSFPDSWWAMFFPGMALLTTVFAITVIGDRLRDRSGLIRGWSR